VVPRVIAFERAPSLADGDGDGDGDGCGDGYGDGSGSGSGYGYGYGCGDGYGDGSGSGYGYGYGSGYGYGYGYGYGDKDEENAATYWAALTEVPSAQRARDAGAVLALWKSRADGRPANGGSLPPVKVGDIHETRGPLMLCEAGTLHATFKPHKWRGERWWVVALYGEIAVADDKVGALKREILAELT
jgi:hypothetical protein